MPKQNYLTLQAQIKKLQDKAETIRAKQKTPILASIVRSMRDFDISLEELSSAIEKGTQSSRRTRGKATPEKRAAKVSRPVAPKYRHPDSGETWTGRGRAPRWLAAAESEGSKREDFLIAQ